MTEQYRLLTGDEAIELRGQLLDRLADRGVVVEAYIIGGAAIAVQLGRDEVTPDVDGLFRPMEEVQVEARVMAAEHITIHGRPVVVASKRRLLAMKLAASRPKDRVDLNRLIVDLGIHSVDELIAIAREAYSEGSMTLPDDPAEVRLIADEALRRAEMWRQRHSQS